jgi:hypothetical protein
MTPPLVPQTRFSALVALTFAMVSPAAADFVINDDLVVDGSTCTGFDCVNGEVFGDDTLRLKEAGLRVHFDDTSADATPGNDWGVEINGLLAGEMSYFGIVDRTAGVMPFAVEAGAPAASLHIDGNGDLGIGTSVPANDIHILSGLAPSIRFEQDGSGGSDPQTWRIFGSHLGFGVNDVIAGTTPFMTMSNAPQGSLVVDTSGNVGVGIGALTPASLLHVYSETGTARALIEEASTTQAAREMFRMQNNGGSYFTLANTASGRDWFFTHENNVGGRFIVTSSTNPSQGLFLAPDGNLSIGGTLTTGGGTCGGGCDRVFSDAYDLPSIAEHAEAMFTLGHLPNVGPTIENTPINVSDKLGRMLNELEHAHIYIAQLEARLAALEARPTNP